MFSSKHKDGDSVILWKWNNDEKIAEKKTVTGKKKINNKAECITAFGFVIFDIFDKIEA